MNLCKRVAAAAIGFTLIAGNVYASKIDITYGEGDKLKVAGSGFGASSVNLVVVAESEASPYDTDTRFAAVKSVTVKPDGSFGFEAKMPGSAPSGYYIVLPYVDDDIRERFFYVNPVIASEALYALSQAAGKSAVNSVLAKYASELGISADLALASVDSDVLAEKLMSLMPDGELDASEFAAAYVGALLCGGKDMSYDEFMDTLVNNAYILGCADSEFLSYSSEKQQEIFAQISKVDITTSEFSDVFGEAALIASLNTASIRSEYENVLFDEFDYMLKLDTSDYDELKYPEKVIRKMMAREFASSTELRDAFYDYVEAQADAEEDSGSKNTGGGGGGGVSSRGSYDAVVPEVLPQTPAVPVPGGASEFSDMKGHWAADAVAALKDKGIIDGVGDGSFAPDRNVTRAEFAKMICEAFDIKASGTRVSFDDVAGGAWYAGYVSELASASVINGISDNLFAPDAYITRQDAAVIMKRTADALGLNLEVTRAEVVFADDADIADYASDAVYTLYAAELINGTGGGRFDAAMSVTRAQAAQMIYNLITGTEVQK